MLQGAGENYLKLYACPFMRMEENEQKGLRGIGERKNKRVQKLAGGPGLG